MMTNITARTIGIGGFSEDYEDACQRMLWRGVSWLSEAQPPFEMWEDYSKDGNEHLTALEGAVLPPDSYDEKNASGSQHDAVMSHLAYIHKHGVDGWLEEAARRDRKVILWTGPLEGPREELDANRQNA